MGPKVLLFICLAAHVTFTVKAGPAGCATGSTSIDGNCQKIGCAKGWLLGTATDKCYKRLPELFNHKAAIAACAQLDAILPEILSAQENSAVHAMLQLEALPKESDSIRLGAVRNGQGKLDFGWTSKAPMTYKNFKDDEMDNKGDWEDCLNMSPTEQWVDVTCPSEAVTVCQRPAYVCEDGWTLGRATDKCYLRENEPMDYGTAAAACEKRGAGLPTIHSAEENAAVLDMRSTEIVEGARDTVRLGAKRTGLGKMDFGWMDATPMDYTNYDDGHMDHLDGEGCLEMWPAGTWNNIKCDRKCSAVCQKEAKTAS